MTKERLETFAFFYVVFFRSQVGKADIDRCSVGGFTPTFFQYFLPARSTDSTGSNGSKTTSGVRPPGAHFHLVDNLGV